MQVLNTGTTYRIYDESMKAFDSLPAAVYKINFSSMTGYSLVKTDNIVIDEKIYGNHLEKVEKVYNNFKAFSRNLGVILSGKKGIGKSLFAKLLSIKAIDNGYPVIICDKHYPGIADFLGSIQQEVVILFDEFDKTFEQVEGCDPQADMLTLFDGLYMGKKLFIITCNVLSDLNDYLVNRPGRFHYHFRFNYPDKNEITEYLKDNLDEEYWGEIEAVVDFSQKVEINFDCLRAIAFELNTGISFSEAITDLNIVNIENVYYDMYLYFKDGTVYSREDYSLDIFNTVEEKIWFYNKKDKKPSIYVSFNVNENIYDYLKGGMVITNDFIEIENWAIEDWDEKQETKDKKAVDELEKAGIDFILIKRVQKGRDLHYNVV